jgi:hypothetical protein
MAFSLSVCLNLAQATFCDQCTARPALKANTTTKLCAMGLLYGGPLALSAARRLHATDGQDVGFLAVLTGNRSLFC